MDHPILLWVGFNVFVLIMLALDLGVFNRKAHVVTVREALIWTGVWIALALLFNLGILYWMGSERALEYLTGYLIEKSLSVDNIFVFLLIFSYFSVPAQYQHKVLFWGILGALVMRAIFIFTGIALIERFHWIIYVFGAFLIFTGIRIALQKEKDIHPERNPLLKLARRLFPVTPGYEGNRFFIRRGGKLMATPLILVLLMVETTDLIFAVDSIPAILAITRDPFIVYTSNVFAILGLRALYFALAGAMRLFHFLHYGLSAILVLVGVKMVLEDFWHPPVTLTLGSVLLILGGSIAASLIWPLPEPESVNPRPEEPRQDREEF
ncbi:MAG: TerC family protein [Candidatus Zixiibacteriota bacterium]|nr:MAG: TerC family protein [candidate division Zixibacteria bacterium]